MHSKRNITIIYYHFFLVANKCVPSMKLFQDVRVRSRRANLCSSSFMINLECINYSWFFHFRNCL